MIKHTPKQILLRKKILDISHDHQYSHLGSCLSCVDLISTIYDEKKKNERFVLSNGHAGVALYAVLEHKKILTRKDIDSFHIHPDRNPKKCIDVSTGSLGQGLPIAVGIALATPTKRTYCLISDGECAEGSIWEALRIIADYPVKNITVLVNANGFTAYDTVSIKALWKRIASFGITAKIIDGHHIADIRRALKVACKSKKSTILFCKTKVDHFSFLKGLDAHYHRMSNDEYQDAYVQLTKQAGRKA